MEKCAHFTRYEQKKIPHQPVQICTGTIACAYNFLTIFSLSSLYLTLSSLSLRRTTLSFFLPSDQSFFLWSIFLPLINLSSSSFRWLPSPLPPPIAFSSFVSRCFWVEWTWSVGFGLNVSRHRHRHRLPLEASILFLILTIATGGVNLVAQGEVSISVWYHFDPFCSRRGVDSGVGFDPFCWVCFSGFLLGCVDCGAIPVWIVGVGFDPFCWVCFSSFLPVGCVDSSVIPMWIVGVGFDPFCWVCFSSFLPVGCVDSNVIPVWIVGVGQWLCG